MDGCIFHEEVREYFMKEKSNYLRALDIFETTNKNNLLINNSRNRPDPCSAAKSVDGEGKEEEKEIMKLEVELQPYAWKNEEKKKKETLTKLNTFIPIADENKEEELKEVVLEVDMEEMIKNVTES